MPLTDEELEAIRVEVASEPATSPARRLLAHIDEEAQVAFDEGLDKIRKKLVNEDGFTPSEAERTVRVYYIEGVRPEFDSNVKCPACEGTGHGEGPGLFPKCRRCSGSKTIMTYKKVPAETRFDREVAGD